ncbi:hypothetical protein [Leptolyngbya sp. PCC 6406]|uniref:hypothetical protein n=1 Tax=Leptolyngbya sp. PCC 6406 TaxID=1173264 RepID=UPI0002AC67CD|nr:hypothetical protein [Leptolyngbya sp. PCC 6406]
MTSTNEAANGQAEAKAAEASAETPRKTTTRRQPKNSIVKSKDTEGESGVILLEDHTRLVVTDSLPNHRPIALSDLEVVGSLNSSGSRPIMANTMEVFSTDLLPGHRPVMVGTLHLSELNFLMGNRPIAPNDTVDPLPAALMGYLD